MNRARVKPTEGAVRRSVGARIMVRLAVLAIRAYQIAASPLARGHCRFAPSCSEYAREALERHGPVRGLGLAVRRLGRCHPLGAFGDDPVPR